MSSDYEKVDVRDRIYRVTNTSDRKIVPFKGQDYEKLRSECLKSGRLFEDPLFPTVDKSMFYTQSVPDGVKWRRPKEISNKPLFIANKVDANDLDQGYLGNCWFIAACAAITLEPEVFANVVPTPQSFDAPYAGIFHFHFWYYGQWVDVCIDDRLPCQRDGRLLFCSNRQEPNEFWAALLEKAYAKLCGNYENLDGGNTTDALVDMTGGIQESFEIKDMRTETMKNEIWQILVKSRQHKSLIGASIAPDPRIKEARLANGLVMGQLKNRVYMIESTKKSAYTVCKVAALEQSNRELRLIRVRNPWGNEVEWRGSWSDNSYEWKAVSNDIKTALDYRNMSDGEFWMGFDDFYRNFETIQLCDLTPEAYSSELIAVRDPKIKAPKLTWKLTAYNGEWVRGKSSGGSGRTNEAAFWTNPQFLVTLDDVDPEDNENMSTLIVSLLQKYTREKRTQNKGESCEQFIQFRLYRILADSDAEQAKKTGKRLYASQLERCATSGPYINLRDITKRFRIVPGHYLIIPSCYDEGVNGEFLLRLYTEYAISEKNCSILHDHKEHLCNEDIFFRNPANLDEAFSSWSSLLNGGDHSKKDSAQAPRSVAKPSATNGYQKPHKPFIKEFKIYLDSQVASVFEKIDVHRKIKHIKL